jgi:predicted dehydrogenase
MFRQLKMGMVGGGRGGLIGATHRLAARLDGDIQLVAGAFSSDPARSQLSGQDLRLETNRVYDHYETMAEKESALSPGERIDFVTIVTPNNLHFSVAKKFLEAGINVVCDKPMTLHLAEAQSLCELVDRSGKVFVLTHNYTGYPMVKHARALVQSGELGEILKIVVEYRQDWLIRPIETEGHKQAVWRTDPAITGATGSVGDIGTHAENLSRYISGLEIEELCADFTTFIKGRRLEDDANFLIRYQHGARGVLYCSQISAGEQNNLSIRVYGKKASLEWHQENPNELLIKYPDAPPRILHRGNEYLGEAVKKYTRLPAGWPEGFIEAFANIYLEATRAITAEVTGQPVPSDTDFPTVLDGLKGMAFIDAAVRSAHSGSSWTKVCL